MPAKVPETDGALGVTGVGIGIGKLLPLAGGDGVHVGRPKIDTIEAVGLIYLGNSRVAGLGEDDVDALVHQLANAAFLPGGFCVPEKCQQAAEKGGEGEGWGFVPSTKQHRGVPT